MVDSPALRCKRIPLPWAMLAPPVGAVQHGAMDCSQRSLLVAVCSIVAFGCGGGDDDGAQACVDEASPELVLPDGVDPESITLEAVLAVEQRFDAITSVGEGDFRLMFFDVSTYDGTPAQILLDSPTCGRVIGQPVIVTRPTALTVTGVRVSGLAGGPVDVGDVTGTYLSDPSPAVLGADPVSMQAMAATGGGDTFPDVDMAGSTTVRFEGVTTRRVGEAMEIRWGPGDADYVEIVMITQDPERPTDPTASNRVLCRVLDDGCHRVPGPAVAWLSIHGNSSALRLERHATASTLPGPTALATVDAVQQHSTTVDLVAGTSPAP